MSEYIDKDKLLNDIECIDISDCTDIDDIFTEVERTIDEQPTADVVEVRHGQWVTVGFGITERVVCSQCKSNKGSYMKPPFCSQCGAKMDGKGG